MARIENTVFISYRRTDVYTALAVYENLTNQGYDVFFDYRSISSGDFEQIITSNIRARAHFLLILTATALDRCDEPDDWLRREIEIAMDEKRNIIPLFFKGFRFGDPALREKLTGKLSNLSRYNGLNVHEDYFDEAMQRLRTQYLNIPLETVLHPVSTEVQRVVRAEQVAADQALEEIEDVKGLVKKADDRPLPPNLQPEELHKLAAPHPEVSIRSRAAGGELRGSRFNFRMAGSIAAGVLVLGLLLWGGSRLLRNPPAGTAEPTGTTEQNLKILAQPSPTFTSNPGSTATSFSTETSIPPTPTLGVGSTLISAKDGMTLLYVPAGEFTMGSGNAFDEQPSHSVTLSAFWIDQTEVTNEMYSLCVGAGACSPPKDTRSYTQTNYYGLVTFNKFPVLYVDWTMATTYCEWVGRRLPTEAEWEKAARGTDGRMYPWGNDAPNSNLLNYGIIVGDVSAVGSYEAGKSFYGAYDMAGNVWEWVNDWYGESYYQGSPPSNPPGPDTGAARVHRGGSFLDFDAFVTATKRDKGDPGYADRNLGFRCAVSAAP